MTGYAKIIKRKVIKQFICNHETRKKTNKKTKNKRKKQKRIRKETFKRLKPPYARSHNIKGK